MDFVYDHTLTSDTPEPNKKGKEPAQGEQKEESLNEEFRQAYQAISNSPWGARLGAFAGSVWKQVCCSTSMEIFKRVFRSGMVLIFEGSLQIRQIQLW